MLNEKCVRPSRILLLLLLYCHVSLRQIVYMFYTRATRAMKKEFMYSLITIILRPQRISAAGEVMNRIKSKNLYV